MDRIEDVEEPLQTLYSIMSEGKTSNDHFLRPNKLGRGVSCAKQLGSLRRPIVSY